MNCVFPVPPLQGGNGLVGAFTRGFTPGYNLTGLQPADLAAPKAPNKAPNVSTRKSVTAGSGLKARKVKARGETPGTASGNISPAL